MRIVVLGESGQLSRSLKKVHKSHLNTIYLSRENAPFENFEVIKNQLEKIKPTHVINTVAYTKVDLAETEQNLCFLINCETPSKIAKWCSENNALFFHYSTDYVFNGKNNFPWTEEDSTDPLNVYGKSKLKSEKEVLIYPTSYVFRTSWVYSEFGQNFVKTMIRLFQEKDELNIINDQFGAPNYAYDLAMATWSVLEKPIHPGLYHLSSQEFCSWYEFALKIEEYCKELGLKLQVKKINPVKSKDYKTPAQRPLNSQLDSAKIRKTFGVELPVWQHSLKKCMITILKG